MLNLGLLTGLCLSTAMQAQAWTGEKQEKPKEKVVLKYGPITPAHRTDEAMQNSANTGLASSFTGEFMLFREMNGME